MGRQSEFVGGDREDHPGRVTPAQGQGQEQHPGQWRPAHPRAGLEPPDHTVGPQGRRVCILLPPTGLQAGDWPWFPLSALPSNSCRTRSARAAGTGPSPGPARGQPRGMPRPALGSCAERAQMFRVLLPPRPGSCVVHMCTLGHAGQTCLAARPRAPHAGTEGRSEGTGPQLRSWGSKPLGLGGRWSQRPLTSRGWAEGPSCHPAARREHMGRAGPTRGHPCGDTYAPGPGRVRGIRNSLRG